MTNDVKSNCSDLRRTLLKAWMLGAFLVGCFFLYRGWTSDKAPAVSTYQVEVTSTANGTDTVATKKIQDVRVGDRAAPVKNPTGEFDDSLGNEVDRAAWRKLELRAEKRDGTYCNIELLRPVWWIEERAAETGGTVFISVPECGIDGNAEVLSISTCPQIQPGTGQVVIGTFAHQSAQVLNIYVEELDEPIGVTANHPFWSETRKDVVPAGNLRPGEQLVGVNGHTRVTKILARGPPESVYNVEVLGEHVYKVSNAGLLVHNDCLAYAKRVLSRRKNGAVVKMEPIRTPLTGDLPGYPVPGRHGMGEDTSGLFLAFHLENGVLRDPAHPRGVPIDDWVAEFAQLNNLKVEQVLDDINFLPHLAK